MPVFSMMQIRVVLAAVLLVVAASAYDDGATMTAIAVRARRLPRIRETSERVLERGG